MVMCCGHGGGLGVEEVGGMEKPRRSEEGDGFVCLECITLSKCIGTPYYF